MMAVGIVVKEELGSLNLWDFYELDRGCELPCGDLHTLLWFLCSPGTREASVSGVTFTGIPRMTVSLTGPLADDRRNLRASFEVVSSRVKRKLSEEERSLFYQKLEEFGGKLNPKVYEILGRPSLPKREKSWRMRG